MLFKSFQVKKKCHIEVNNYLVVNIERTNLLLFLTIMRPLIELDML